MSLIIYVSSFLHWQAWVSHLPFFKVQDSLNLYSLAQQQWLRNPVGNKLCSIIMSPFLLFCLLVFLFAVNLGGLRQKISQFGNEFLPLGGALCVRRWKWQAFWERAWNKVWGLLGSATVCNLQPDSEHCWQCVLVGFKSNQLSSPHYWPWSITSEGERNKKTDTFLTRKIIMSTMSWC